MAQELGVSLHGSPYAGLTAGVHALGESGDPLLDAVLAGDRLCAFGVLGHDGIARNVDGAPDADALLLLDDGAGELLVLDEPGTWEVRPEPHRFDVSRSAGDVVVLAADRRTTPAPANTVQLHRLLLAADAVGCVRRTLDRTVAYAGQREAFGRPIGGFQAVQHRLADHAVRVRGMRLLVAEAARLLTEAAPHAHRYVALAELSVSGSATHVIHDLLQLTGAIGFTWEHGLHLHERRAHQDARLAANPRSAARTLAGIEGWAR